MIQFDFGKVEMIYRTMDPMGILKFKCPLEGWPGLDIH